MRYRVRTPTLLQMESVECGATSLGIILNYYDRFVPLVELRQACNVSRDGTSASSILKAARYYGLEAEGYRQELEELVDLPCPYIVFWNLNHFLVVEGCDRQRVYLNDPATGRRSVSFAEFDAAYTGIVLLLQPGENFQPGGKQLSVMRGLVDRLRGVWGALAYCVLAGFLLVLLGLAIATLTQVFIDQILLQKMQDWLRPLLLGLLITTIGQGVLTGLRSCYLRRLEIKLAVKLSSQFLWHILHLPVLFYSQRYAGEIASRVSINDRIADTLSGQLTTTLIDGVMIIFYAVVMVWYDLPLTLMGIGLVLLNILALQWVARRRTDAYSQLAQEFGKMSGWAIAGLQNIETIKASGSEADFFSRWAGYQAKAMNMQQSLGRQDQPLVVLPLLVSHLMRMSVLVIGSFRVMDGHLSIGMLVAFQSLMNNFLAPVQTLVNLGSTLQELKADLQRLDDVLQNPIDPQVSPTWASPRSIDPKYADPLAPIQGYLDLKGVTFGYSCTLPPLIEDFDLSLQPGQRVALVGGSGSGKSTIARLVCGLYEPWQGEIRIDGKLRSQIPRAWLSQSIALVEQNIFLFAGSVRDNLSLWDNTLLDRDLFQASRDAMIHEVILAKPGGYYSELLEGGRNFSGGQRQRLEITRALANNPAILVLDEATSALDAETEAQVQAQIRNRCCTCLIIAHRLSTIRDCDEIIVLDRGKVVQRGTHATLQTVPGRYAELLHRDQF